MDDHIKDLTSRFAGEGFVVLAPDLYHGQVTSDPGEAMKLLQGTDDEEATKELNGAVAHLKSQPFCASKAGIIGYCFGGGLSIATARVNRDLDACVVYYGANPNPLDLVQNITCPILALYAGHDEANRPSVPDLEAALQRYSKQYECIVYPDAPHAFFNDRSPDLPGGGGPGCMATDAGALQRAPKVGGVCCAFLLLLTKRSRF